MTLSFATMAAIAFTWLTLGDAHASAAITAETPAAINRTHEHAAFPGHLSVELGSRRATPDARSSGPLLRVSQYRETPPQPERGGGISDERSGGTGSGGRPSETDTGSYRPDRGSDERRTGADRWGIDPSPHNPCLVFPDDYPCTDKKKVR